MTTTRSVQVINGSVCRVKLEVRIKEFDALMDLYEPGAELCSEGAASPQIPRAIWRLQVFPNGRLEEHKGYSTFFVQLIGPMVENKESINASCQIHLIHGSGEEKTRIQKRANFRFGGEEDTPFSDRHGAKCFHKGVRAALHEDGSLLVVAQVDVLVPDQPSVVADFTPNAAALKARQMGRIGGLLESGLNSDCSIEVGEKIFRAHKAILSASSPTFAAMFGNESCYREDKEGVLRMDESEPAPVHALLDYIYTGEIDWDRYEEWEADVLRLADKYTLLDLKTHMEHRFAVGITTPAKLLEMLQLADRYNCLVLKQACLDYYSSHRYSVTTLPELESMLADAR